MVTRRLIAKAVSREMDGRVKVKQELTRLTIVNRP